MDVDHFDADWANHVHHNHRSVDVDQLNAAFSSTQHQQHQQQQQQQQQRFASMDNGNQEQQPQQQQHHNHQRLPFPNIRPGPSNAPQYSPTGVMSSNLGSASLYPSPPCYSEPSSSAYLAHFDASGLTQSLSELASKEPTYANQMAPSSSAAINPSTLYPSPPCYTEPNPSAYLSHFDAHSLTRTLTNLSSSSSSEPSATSGTVPDEDKDKRQRNTLASARFRAKKRQREEEMKAEARQKSQTVEQLQSRVGELEAENKFLKRLLLEKNDFEDEKSVSGGDSSSEKGTEERKEKVESTS